MFVVVVVADCEMNCDCICKNLIVPFVNGVCLCNAFVNKCRLVIFDHENQCIVKDAYESDGFIHIHPHQHTCSRTSVCVPCSKYSPQL